LKRAFRDIKIWLEYFRKLKIDRAYFENKKELRCQSRTSTIKTRTITAMITL
jgi:hypothetical protein